MGSITSRLCGDNDYVDSVSQRRGSATESSSGQIQAFELATHAGTASAETRGGQEPNVVATTRLGTYQPAEARGSHVESQRGPSSETLSDLNVQRLASATYQEGRIYHGTSQDRASFMRSQGMDTRNKTGTTIDQAALRGRFPGSSPEEINTFKEQSNSYNYLTTKKEPSLFIQGATNYAHLAASDGSPPYIIRVMTSKEGHGLEPDPDSSVDNPLRPTPAYRTKSQIPAGNILPSKNSPVTVTDASEAFKERFNTSDHRPNLKVDTTLTSEQAAKLLNEQQTPSAIDFPENL